MFRIQKILLSEFDEIYEPILVENPFTLVDERGIGLYQYHIGLTANKILFGCDSFDSFNPSLSYSYIETDPAIETFSLVSMLPLDAVGFRFFSKSGRLLMRLLVTNNGVCEKPLLFEFGGHIYKQLMWSTWRDHIAMLRINKPNYSHLARFSPGASTDITLEDDLQQVVVHSQPKPSYTSCHSTFGSASS